MKKREFVAMIILLFVIAALIGCSTDSTVGPEEKDPIAENKAMAQRFFDEVWNQGDLAVLDEICAPNYVLHDAAQNVDSLAALKQYVVMHRTAFPDIQFIVDEQFAETDKVVSRFTASGTHQAELMGIPPTNAQAIFTGIVISRIENGKIAEAWINKDDMGLLQQLGVIPTMGRSDFTWGAPAEVTGDPNPAANKVLFQKMFDEVWNKVNLNVVDTIFATGYVLRDPVWLGEVHGPEAFKQYVTVTFTGFPDTRFTILDIIAEGDKIGVRWTWSGTHQGDFVGIPPTGKQIMITGITIHRFANGKLVESCFSYDMLGMLGQLGIVPPPGGLME
ncbi:MAG: ester cyclase [Calditrichia bacterium]|nr:ester cyclase [Calditrichia bacterium]